jgi:kynurenine formamidase
MTTVALHLGGVAIRADLERGFDLSIPLRFSGAQPSAFGAPPASAAPLRVGDFVGDVAQGGSCNCAEVRFVPHCNGTHTECVGHVSREAVHIHEIRPRGLEPALLLSVATLPAAGCGESSDPPPQPGDRLITARALAAAWQRCAWPQVPVRALVLRTLPNAADKPTHRYEMDSPPPYVTREAAQWLVEHEIEHLLLDVPSMDRLDDGGRLTAHRIFWGLPPGSTDAAAAARAHATITELVFAADAVPDGRYLLDLHIPAFAADAAPSRPILFPLIGAA